MSSRRVVRSCSCCYVQCETSEVRKFRDELHGSSIDMMWDGGFGMGCEPWNSRTITLVRIVTVSLMRATNDIVPCLRPITLGRRTPGTLVYGLRKANGIVQCLRPVTLGRRDSATRWELDCLREQLARNVKTVIQGRRDSVSLMRRTNGIIQYLRPSSLGRRASDTRCELNCLR